VPRGGAPWQIPTKRLNDSDIGQWLSFASNFSGTLQGIVAVISLFQESDTDKILNAIDQLKQDIDRDFKELGDLIQQQTQIIVDNQNRDAMALALSRSDIAASRIQEFLSSNNAQALETAKTESIGGVRFFTELGVNAPDLPFFMPGLVKAGTIRIFVIASEPLALREPPAVVVDDLNLMVTFLAAMIDAVKREVDAAHIVNRLSHFIRCAPLPQLTVGPPGRTVFVIDSFAHEEDGIRLAFFDAQRGNPPCEQPSGFENEAQMAAIQARNQGVADELAFLGVPAVEQILQSWRNLLMA
jgi:hypothetical protein